LHFHVRRADEEAPQVEVTLVQLTPGDTMFSSAFRMQRIPELRFFATLGEEPEVEVALV